MSISLYTKYKYSIFSFCRYEHTFISNMSRRISEKFELNLSILNEKNLHLQPKKHYPFQ